MKSTGIVRRIDDLGRIVIPKEVRDILEMQRETPIEIFVNSDTVILKKYVVGCSFCGATEENQLHTFKQKKLCSSCIEKIVRYDKTN